MINKIKLGPKLTGGFIFVALLCAFVGYRGIMTMTRIQERLASVYNDRVAPLKQLKTIADMYAVNIVDTSHKTRNGRLTWAQARQNIAQARATIAREWEAYLATELTDEEKKLADDLKQLTTTANVSVDQLLAILNREDQQQLESYTIQELYSAIDPVSEKVSALVDLQLRVAKADYEAAVAAAAAEKFTLWAVILASMGAALLLGILLTRSITRPLGRTVAVLQAVAEADFSRQIEVQTQDEVGQMTISLNQATETIGAALHETVTVLEAMATGDFTKRLDLNTKGEILRMATALNEAIDRIGEALHEVRDVADSVASASQQLSASTEQIASGAQEQASSLEETAASLEEITSTVKQNADNAQQANQLANGSRDIAEQGGQVVESAVAAMGEINKSSKKIADIITAIDEIAFQTNLLALNAAVEAARAGEQGRGFAVVAAEVRNLAQRSATAAKEIKGLIQDSVQKVEDGSELVNQSGQTLQEIVTSVKRVTDIVSEIAAASREQSSGIEQVNRAITQMDQVTQANAAQTEELSGTAESLAAKAEQLQATVARFKLTDRGTGQTEAPVKASPRAASKPVKKPASAPTQAKQAEPVIVNASGHVNGLQSMENEFEEF